MDASDLQDYEKWANEEGGWRKLVAAVRGGAAIGTGEGRAEAGRRVNPETLITAGQAFAQAHQVLVALQRGVRVISQSVAGPGQSWQGEAADAFLKKMDDFTDWLGAQAERIAGAEGSTGNNAVHDQLYHSGNVLAWAQERIHLIDTLYAQASLKADSSRRGSDGNIAITGTMWEKPMTNHMLTVVRELATQYEMTYSKVTPPTDTGSQVTPPDMPESPDLSMPDVPGPVDLSAMDVPGPVDLSAMDVPGPVDLPATDVPAPVDVPSLTGLSDSPGGFGAQQLNAAPPPSADLATAPEIPGGLDALPTSGIPGGSGPNVPLASVPSGGGLPDFESGPSGAGPPEGETFAAPKIPPTSGPGGVNVPDLPPAVVPSGGGIGPISGVPIPAGMPQGVNSPGGGASTPGLPDASGLVSGDPSDWQLGGVDGVDIPGAPGGVGLDGVGSDQGLNVPDLPSSVVPPSTVPDRDDLGSGSGMPFAPAMPPQGGSTPGGGASVPELPDAGGLVSGDPTDWQPAGVNGVDIPGAPGGVARGGAGLDGSGTALPAASEFVQSPTDGIEQATPGANMAALPPGGVGNGAPAGGNAQAPDSPDAGGLVSGDADDWVSGPVGSGNPDAPRGVQAGGVGLDVSPPPGTPVAPVSPESSDWVPGGVETPAAVPHQPLPIPQVVLPPLTGPTERADRRKRAGAPAGVEVADTTTGPEVAAVEPTTTAEAAPEDTDRVAAIPGPPIAPTSARPADEPARPAAAVVGSLLGVSVPGIGPDGTPPPVPAGAVPGRPSTGDAKERPEPERPKSAELLQKEAAAWGAGPAGAEVPLDDDRVPVVRPGDDDEDPAGWDDAADSWWLMDEGGTPDQKGTLTDA
ncbi:hypothetical protein [Micromonospora sp. NBC_00858]|uniref:hypothetical protein n=1 Tax=Micromonospora sp. NBC_00858 TaxID=2975979 RepID=UPI003864E49E|nr:hypothetical protein OG990_30315 [Micromonospora sp. NBC_00858]